MLISYFDTYQVNENIFLRKTDKNITFSNEMFSQKRKENRLCLIDMDRVYSRNLHYRPIAG